MLKTFSIKPPSISKINPLFLYIFVGTTGAVFLFLKKLFPIQKNGNSVFVELPLTIYNVLLLINHALRYDAMDIHDIICH